MNRLLLIIGFISSLAFYKVYRISSELNASEKQDSINLNVFIGEKISVTEFNPNVNNIQIEIDSISGDTIQHINYVMDYAYNAKYKVLKNVFNDLNTDTISFVAYNHYGRPGFENYDYVLLYLSYNKEKEHYYHQKYLFDALKKQNKKWQGLSGESINQLFSKKKNGVLKARGVF